MPARLWIVEQSYSFPSFLKREWGSFYYNVPRGTFIFPSYLRKNRKLFSLFGKKPVPLNDWEEFKEDLKYFVK